MQVEGPGRLERINSSRATATSPMSNRQNGTTSNETNNKAFNANSTRNHDREDHASVATGGGNSSCEDRVKDSPPVTDSRRRAQKAGVVRRRSRQRQSLELEDRCGRNSPVGEKHVSESPFSSHGQGYENSASAITARVSHRPTHSRSGGGGGGGGGSSGSSGRGGGSGRRIGLGQEDHMEQASRATTSVTTTASTTKSGAATMISASSSSSAATSAGKDVAESQGGRGGTRVRTTSETLQSENSHGSTRRARETQREIGASRHVDNDKRDTVDEPQCIDIPSDYISINDTVNNGNESSASKDTTDAQHVLPDSTGDKPHRSGHRSRYRTVAHLNTSSLGGRRFPHCHHHHQHHPQHQQQLHHHSISDANHSSNSSIPPTSNHVTHSHHTHTRNFSSPSLLDSFMSPEPMLSPIQSYFGSDPNSPASSFSLPRHDHYPRLPIDHGFDSSESSAPMDGYHGFATHPWSEQSTTPARALSHRWTRRLSQPDPYPNHRGVHSSQNAIRSSGLRSFSIVSSRPFAPAAIDQPWSEDTPSVIADEDPSAMNESYDSEQDLSQAVDTTQNSADEGTMDDSYGDYDSSSIYDHNYDYNHNLRNWDEDDQLNSDEAYPYGYQVPGDEAREDVDVNDGEDEDLDSDQHLDEIIGTEQQERSHDGGLSHDLVDLSDEEAEEAHILGFGHQQTESSALTDFDHEPTSYSRPILPSSPGPSPRVEAMLETVETEMSAADEALARRLQEEEYAALIGERRSISSTLLSPNSPFRSFAGLSPRWPSDYGFALGVASSYPDRTRYHSAARTPRSDETRRHSFRNLSPAARRDRNTATSLRNERTDLRLRSRPSGARSAFIESHSASSRLVVGETSRWRPRSPPSQVLPSSLTRTLQNNARTLALLERLGQYLEGDFRMRGNPADYLPDDQVDDSYEGLLRLGERIGEVKPKGVSEDVLRSMNRHIASWRHMRAKKAGPSSDKIREGRSEDDQSPSWSSSSTAIDRSQGKAMALEDTTTEDENCTICLQTYELPDLLRSLPCRHAFHVNCIDTWLRNNAQCPICRQEVTTSAVESMP